MNQREINHIQLYSPINGKVFLSKGDKVRVEEGELVNGIPTHSISTLWGNGLGKAYGVSVIELGTLYLSEIKF